MLRESAKAINTQVDLKAITDDTAGDGADDDDRRADDAIARDSVAERRDHGAACARHLG